MPRTLERHVLERAEGPVDQPKSTGVRENLEKVPVSKKSRKRTSKESIVIELRRRDVMYGEAASIGRAAGEIQTRMRSRAKCKQQQSLCKKRS